MDGAKNITLKVIPSNIAVAFVRAFHYSGTVTNNSVIHFGAFTNGELHGVISLGQGIDKRKTIGLVEGTGWREYLEINRMAFDDTLPPNSESRALAIMIRLLKKSAPQIKWLLSYADATQCGDGAIYRAAGFHLTRITPNKSMYRLPDGTVVCKIVFEASFGTGSGNELKVRYGKVGQYASWTAQKYLTHIGASAIPGFQLRYIKLLRGGLQLNTPILPYSAIDEAKAGMYKGEKKTREERRQDHVAPAV